MRKGFIYLLKYDNNNNNNYSQTNKVKRDDIESNENK